MFDYFPPDIREINRGDGIGVAKSYYKGGGSSSSSQQKTISKDNSAALQDDAQNASDGSNAAKAEDSAQVAGGSINQGNLNVGAGADVQIEQVSDDIALGAFDLIAEADANEFELMKDFLSNAKASQESANHLSRVTNETLAKKSSDADSAVSETLQKNIIAGGGIVAAAIVLTSFFKSK